MDVCSRHRPPSLAPPDLLVILAAQARAAIGKAAAEVASSVERNACISFIKGTASAKGASKL